MLNYSTLAAAAVIGIGVSGTGSFLVSSPANAAVVAQVCTRDYNGYLNVRNRLGTHGRVIGRVNNGQYISLTGWNGQTYNGYRWYQTSGNGWVRSDYLCNPRTNVSHGPGNF